MVGTWNVRSLVEGSGGLRVCRKRYAACGHSESVDRKLDLLVKELERYGVSVAGIQESKWFGKDVWPGQMVTLFCTLGDHFHLQMMWL